MAAEFSILIITFNEEIHLRRLLNSLRGLKAEIFVLDSGSTDQTLAICNEYQVSYAIHAFENHPKQWHKALTTFPINSPWVIALDADQSLSPELYQQLVHFKQEDYQHVDGIYFNRKNIFQGKWIRYGGYYPKYMLKMFRTGCGYSDLNENMDHRFIVPGPTTIWKQAHLLEENLKENKISFWIDKHNRYSDLLAIEELERQQNLRFQTVPPKLFGTPDQRTAWCKQLWWKLPRYGRVFAYFAYRIWIQKGILDGKKGLLFHFLQGFWFRLIVDVKIEEMLATTKRTEANAKGNKTFLQPLTFSFLFLVYFLLLYTINLVTIGITTPGGYYVKTADHYFNYIKAWRQFDITCTGLLLQTIGYKVTSDEFSLHIVGRSGFILVYSCLGYGLLSVYAAFTLAFPKPLKEKVIFLISGLIGFQLLNMLRLCLIAIYWKPSPMFFKLNAHEVFNVITYAIIIGAAYYWINYSKSISNE